MNERKARVCTLLFGIILLALWISSMLIKNSAGTSLYDFMMPIFSNMFVYLGFMRCITRFHEWLTRTDK